MSLKRQLNLLGKEVNKRYPQINSGGCGIYAAMIILALRKHGIESKAIIAGANAKEFNSAGISIAEYANMTVTGDLSEWNEHGVSFSHVGIEFELDGSLKHYDSNGVKRAKKKLDHWHIYEGRLDYSDLRKVIRNQTGWNTSFDRKNIPGIRRLVKEYLAV